MSEVEIYNLNCKGIVWNNASQCKFLCDEHVEVWRIGISSNISFLDDCLKLLNADEKIRGNKYFHERDRVRFVISRGALRSILSLYTGQPANAIEFQVSTKNKPFIVDPGKMQIHFNISHSGNWIIIAISNAAIGADVEFIDANFKYEEILPFNFDSKEIDFISQNDVKSFFLLWTRKEAILKATGQGLVENLNKIPALDGKHVVGDDLLETLHPWQLSSFEFDDNYVASVASKTDMDRYRFWNVDFKEIIDEKLHAG